MTVEEVLNDGWKITLNIATKRSGGDWHGRHVWVLKSNRERLESEWFGFDNFEECIADMLVAAQENRDENSMHQ